MRRVSPALLLIVAAASAGCVRTPPAPTPGESATTVGPVTAVAIAPVTIASGASSAAAPDAPAEAPRPRTLATLPLFDAGLGPKGFFPRGDAFEQGLDGIALDELVREAEATKSDSLIVVHHGRVVVERYFGKKHGPIETMSVTKSLVSLAIGALIADGAIASVDTPVSTFFPEWAEGDKAKVTLRHLLTHTSGLEHLASAQKLNSQKDRVAYARALPLVDAPGATFSYSNEATALLSGIIAIAAKKPVDVVMKERFFEPLGIKDYGWAKDRSGAPQTFYGAALRGRDLAKLGVMMLQRGTWEEKQLLPASWVAESTAPGAEPSHFYGYLWWTRFDSVERFPTKERLALLEKRGFTAVDNLLPLVDQRFSSEQAFWLEAGSRLDNDEREAMSKLAKEGVSPLVVKPGTPIGYAADGWLGQYLAVYPAEELVAVRQHRAQGSGEEDNVKHGFRGFFDRIRATFVGSKPAR